MTDGEPTTGRARVPPAPVASLDWGARLAIGVIRRATGGEVPNVFTTFARHRRLFRSWLPFAGWLLFRTDLPRGDVELVVLRTACNTDSAYEWAQHVELARRAGLTMDEIDAVPDWPSHAWPPRHRAILVATDELHDHRVITDATWTELARHLTEHELLELCFLVGHYEMVAMALNSLGVEPDPAALARLDGDAAAFGAGTMERLGRRRLGSPA